MRDAWRLPYARVFTHRDRAGSFMAASFPSRDDRDSKAVDANSSQPRFGHELGIVLVHGIGSQSQGSTMIKWADSLVDALSLMGKHDVSVSRSRLRPVEDVPSTAQLTFRRPEGLRTWLMAEAHWQRELIPPAYSSLVFWTVRVLPLAITLHTSSAANRIRSQMQGESTPLRVKRAISLTAWLGIIFPCLCLAAPLLASCSIALLIVGLLPIAAVRNLVRRIQRALTGAVGDAMTLLDSPTQGAAMTSTVIDGIQYLRDEGCRKIAILAHSQGASVAQEALIVDSRVDIDGLITVGSGINKLGGLRRGSDARIWVWLPMLALLAVVVMTMVTLFAHDGLQELFVLAIWTGAIAVALIVTITILEFLESLAGRIVRNTSVSRATDYAIPGAILAAIAYIFVAADDAWKPSNFQLAYAICFLSFISGSAWGLSETDDATVPALADRIRRWLDLYTRYDVVPNGPTLTVEPSWPTSLEVRNVDSVILDHNRYTGALDDCVWTIGDFLLQLEEVGERAWLRPQIIRRAAGWRHWRLSHLRVARWTLILSVLNALIPIWPALPRYGSQLYAASGIGRIPGTWVDLPARLDSGEGLLMASAVVGIGCGTCSFAITRFWEIWDSWDRRKADELAGWVRFAVRYGFLSTSFLPSLLMPYLLPNYWAETFEGGLSGSLSWVLWSQTTAPFIVPLAITSFLSLERVSRRLAKPADA